jgi:nucleoside-diphosphate-sugar epimerase
MLNTLIIGQDGLIGGALTGTIRVQSQKSKRIVGISRRDMDLSCSFGSAALRSLMSSSQYDNVIILAAIKRQDGDGREEMLANNKITDNIARSLIGYTGHITYISSCAVYGEKNQQKDVRENHAIAPTSFYGMHKVYSEEVYRSIIDNSKLLILRPALVYGHHSSGYDPMGFLNMAMSENKVQLWGDGLELRELIHVYDAARVIASLSKRKTTGIVNLVAGISYSYRDVVREIQRHMPVSVIHKERSVPSVNHTYIAHTALSDSSFRPFIAPWLAIRLELARRISLNAC